MSCICQGGNWNVVHNYEEKLRKIIFTFVQVNNNVAPLGGLKYFYKCLISNVLFGDCSLKEKEGTRICKSKKKFNFQGSCDFFKMKTLPNLHIFLN